MLQKHSEHVRPKPTYLLITYPTLFSAYLKLVLEMHLCLSCIAPVLVVPAGPAPTDLIGSLTEHCPEILAPGWPRVPDPRVGCTDYGEWQGAGTVALTMAAGHRSIPNLPPALSICGLILCIHLWKVCVSLSKDGLIDPCDKLSISKQTTQRIRSLKLLKKIHWYPHYKWTHRKSMDTGPLDGLVPPCNKPLPEAIL